MRRISLDTVIGSPDLLAGLREALGRGGVAAIPTETFYGLAADPFSPAGVERIFALKGRTPQKGLLVLFSSLEQLDPFAIVPEPRGPERFQAIWPAALTAVFATRRPWPGGGADSSVAVRMPAHPGLRRLLAAVGPLTGTSANESGAPALSEADEVAREFGDRIDFLVDGGPTPGGRPSTLVDARVEPPRVLREGAYPFRLNSMSFGGTVGILKSYAGKTPVVGRRVYLAETAAVIGDVVLGDDVSIWYNSVVRGDCHFIRVGDRTNIQDNCVLHVTQGTHPTILEEEVTLGHAAVVHGATVRKGALIGIRATVMDGADIGESAFVGAGALVTPRTKVPARTLWLGAPARRVRDLSAGEVEDLRHYHLNYLGYKEEYFRTDGRWAG